MKVYYNEVDEKALAWLRELIRRRAIPDGEIDVRSIADVQPDDLRGFDQCHFFAGIGGWALALRLAGWDRPCWTGSCPCQPFAAPGRKQGFADPRHLWPEWFRLIRQCRPDTVFGEQVDKAVAWLDLVAANLESENYAFGPADLPAASIGTPQLRHRLWWVAESDGGRREEQRTAWLHERWAREGSLLTVAGDADGQRGDDAARRGPPHGVVNGVGAGLEGHRGDGDNGHQPGRNGAQAPRPVAAPSAAGRVASPNVLDARDAGVQRGGGLVQPAPDPYADLYAAFPGLWDRSSAAATGRPDPDHGGWDGADWLLCRDGKFRPVEPGTFPLAHGLPARVGRLRGYGNAIVPQLAAEFIQAYAETL